VSGNTLPAVTSNGAGIENWCNTTDDTPPSSEVLALAPTQSSPTFAVDWSGTDSGSGIADYTIFVSENGGPFTAFIADTPDTSALFTGQTGNTYAFYSVARDAVGPETDHRWSGARDTCVRAALTAAPRRRRNPKPAR